MPLFLRDKLLPVLLGLGVVAGTFVLQRYEIPVASEILTRIEYLFYDQRMELALDEAREPDPRVVIIDIDEKSLREQGHWPWPRDRIADLVEKLWGSGAVVVAFDMVFAEPERNLVDEVGRELEQRGLSEPRLALESLRETLDHDRHFAETLAGGDVVMGLIFRRDGGASVGGLPAPAQRLPAEALPHTVIPQFPLYTANLPQLQQAAQWGGSFNVEPDGDGVIRRVPLIVRHGNEIYPSLALETMRLYALMDDFEIHTARVGQVEAVEAIRIGQTVIPTDEVGRAYVPYRGPRGSFRYVSATDVINGRASFDELAGTIALVGTSAVGLYDMRSTPVSENYPGVEVHANVIAGMLDNRFPSAPKWVEGVNYVIIISLGLFLAVLLPYLSPLWLLTVTIGSLGLVLSGNYWAWSQHGLILAGASPTLMVLAITGVNLAYGFLIENRRREYLKSRFGEYVPPQLVEEMSRRSEDFGFEGESREMTVLFADIRSFTTISEALDAADLKAMLNRFFTPMTRIIFEQRGTIDKYVGDMIMAFWGAPLADPEHRFHAIDAALRMLEEVQRLRQVFRSEGLPSIEIGIGLNTGFMNVGDMGSEYRRAYTVIGDAVNLGSRLEGLTKFYGVNLVVSESTKSEQEANFVFRKLDLVRVKGKHTAVQVFEPVCRREDASDALLGEVNYGERAFGLYLEQRWDEAEQAYRELATLHPKTKLYRLYLDRIEELRRRPPPQDWDGSYTRKEK